MVSRFYCSVSVYNSSSDARVQWFINDKPIESGHGVVYKHQKRRLELHPEYLVSLTGSSKVSCTVKSANGESLETVNAFLNYHSQFLC